MSVQPIPDAYRGVTSYLVVRGAARALDFYQKAFGAEVVFKMDMPGDKVGHAEMALGGGRFMLADEFPDMGFRSPESIGGSPISLLVYVEDVDAAFARAIEAGATELRPVANQFYGDRSGMLRDPFGHVWSLATHIEDVPHEELDERAAKAFGECGDHG